MPFFDYLCDDCGDVFEFLTAANCGAEADPIVCPACGSGKAARQVNSRVAIKTSLQNRGRVMDLSSGACPCNTHKHPHH